METGVGSLILALGSNLGDREQHLETALRKIEERIGRISSLSALYHTRPVG
ncbi:MAG: 2-amino-4-hydroxy-6-hydroxymethyldihydropteridine diphosphokinase, partial [Proteiniphilum sp.]|nr:2-amino-4-hydroxy-6-hydroxymethyldihydropteridine diphosphokinase [Proteiniphilum sp.]